MKKKNSARDNLNLFFSAFLVVAYIICAYFFISFASTLGGTAQSVVMAVVFAIFGLLLFYATRVGDGKSVIRFSAITLILLDLPALYAILASIVPALPLNQVLVENPMLVYMAAVALGYGLPYTFISGFETVDEFAEVQEEAVETEEPAEVVEGGLEEELSEDVAEEVQEEIVDEVVVEGVSAEETEVVETEETAE